MKKQIFMGILIIVLLGLAGCQSNGSGNKADIYMDEDSIEYMSKVDNQNFLLYKDNTWEKVFLKGVNIGATKPGYFPGEFGITKEDYLRWFQYISDMNANTIRVYTILKPDFYDALYEFNTKAKNPLYLIQGVWINEENIATYKDAYNPLIRDNFKKDIETTIDVLHGNKMIKQSRGYAYGTYDSDVSPYVIGYIWGIEWNPDFVISTNEKNAGQKQFDGEYLYTENASPFETFLCEEGNYGIEYETKNYQSQKPISFVNWFTTDTLKHANEPLVNEDLVSINMENIKKKDTFKVGIFASYHIYPYYPDSMNYQKDYISYTDENGEINTYRAYLKDLKKEHSMPVLVAEFGVPSARGKAHDNIYMGYNQGNISEEAQGTMDAAMMEDIYEEEYAGGLVFSFQDEWFKKTWNTMDFDFADRRAYWNNQQTNEQHFGLLAFDSGADESPCYIDGDIQDWEGNNPISINGEMQLSIKSDEAYIYFMVRNYQLNANNTLCIPIDTIPNQGNSAYQQTQFKADADFIILIHGKNNSKILVDPYYDSFQYIYGEKLGMIPPTKNYNIKNSGEFVPQYLCTSKEIYLPQDKVLIPFQSYDTSMLVYGNANPSSNNYNSLADYCEKGSTIEIRIPWQLLNVMDPSSKAIMDDLHLNGIKSRNIESISVGVGIVGSNQNAKPIELNSYSLNQWDIPTYHERLKSSYYIMQDAFAKY